MLGPLHSKTQGIVLDNLDNRLIAYFVMSIMCPSLFAMIYIYIFNTNYIVGIIYIYIYILYILHGGIAGEIPWSKPAVFLVFACPGRRHGQRCGDGDRAEGNGRAWRTAEEGALDHIESVRRAVRPLILMVGSSTPH